jgi:hypothetical protein
MAHALVTRNAASGISAPEVGLRERKKARLRQQIIDTSIKAVSQTGVRGHADRRHRAGA